MRRAAKVDGNQKEIVTALKRVGALVLHTHQLKNCFDILVAFRGKLYCMEIKDPEQPPSARRLTEGEETFKRRLEATGNTYYIVETIDQAIETITKKQ